MKFTEKCRNFLIQLDDLVYLQKMLKKKYMDAKFGIDTAENEPKGKSDVSWLREVPGHDAGVRRVAGVAAADHP